MELHFRPQLCTPLTHAHGTARRRKPFELGWKSALARVHSLVVQFAEAELKEVDLPGNNGCYSAANEADESERLLHISDFTVTCSLFAGKRGRLIKT